MRRPLKPFVTEYKPSTRRQLTPTRQPQSFTTEAAKSGEGGRFDTASRSDDTYEAALRAADALFSPQKDKAQRSSDHDGDDMDETNGSRDAAGRGSGRILRVLDEPLPGSTIEMMDELERERAPKRRGRKPGSKNKPKADLPTASVATSSDAHVPDPHAMFVPACAVDDGVGAVAAHDQPVTDGHFDRDHPHEQDRSLNAEAAGHVAGHVTPLPSRARRRFSWVRTKLKPGQEWKRRLPKVCW